MPLLSFGEEDVELWRDDPHEYVRKGYDVIEDIYSSKTAAMGVIDSLCASRKKSQLDPIMAHIVSIMTECSGAVADPSPAAATAACRLDGGLLAVGTLSDRLKKEARYKTQLEPMIQQHVIPLFSSPHGHLRAKGCWLAGLYADTHFAEGQGRGPTFTAMLQCVIASLSDPELPVRVDAGVAVRSFVDAVEAEDLGPLRPLVPDLLQRFLAISHEVDSEDLTSSLETVVERFGSDMGPYAVTVVTALTQQFWRAIAEEESAAGGGDDDGDFAGGALAGYSVLRAISTVLDAVSSLPELYPQLEELLYPILQKYTSEEGLDVFEEVTQLITYLTYFAPGITPRMWTLYPRLLNCLDTWAIDYWKDVLLPLDNYISRGPDALLVPGTPSSLLDMTNQTLAKALSLSGSPAAPPPGSDAGTEAISEGIQCSAQLISVILQNLKGKVDHCIAPYLQLIVGQLHGGKDLDREVQDALLVAGADALYYNPALTLNSLASAGTLSFFMGALASSIGQKRKNGNMKHFIGVREKKVVALGLTAVLGVPPAQLPTGVAETTGQVAAAVVALLLALKTQQDVAASRVDGASDAGSSDDGLGRLAGGSGDESDDESDDDGDGDARLKRMAAAARRAGHADLDDDDWDSADEVWSEDEDEEVGSPLDSISPYVYFAETLQAVQNSDAAAFAAITSRMDGGTQAAVQGMMAYATELKNAQLAAAAAAAGGQ